MNPARVCLIMAGGSGERFWPLSRQLRPKQLLRLIGDRTLLEQTIERSGRLVPLERIFIGATRQLQTAICSSHTGLPDDQIIVEPAKRNTAGCLAWATAHLLARYPDQRDKLTLAVLSSDGAMSPLDRFQAVLETALEAAERESALVIIGSPPNRVETGFGYIEIQPDATPIAELSGNAPVFPVTQFREKPDRLTAEMFLASGRFLWNTGMFCWRVKTFLDELATSSPVHAQAIEVMAQSLRAGRISEAEQAFSRLPDCSIDYALMEKARRVLVVKADFEWDDLGAWDALDRIHPHDAQGNVTVGRAVLLDVHNSVVVNEVEAEKIAVAVVGVENLVVVVTPDAVLVVPKDRAQEVRQVVAQLKAEGRRQV